MSGEKFTLAVAVNDFEVLRNNLYLSPDIRNGTVRQLIIKENYPSASLAYNSAIDEAINDIVIFVHQDVYFPENWFSDLERCLDRLAQERTDWGVLGCFGARKGAPPGGVGRIYTTGLGVHGERIRGPEPVETLDEIVLVIRKSSGLTFDASLPHFHLYGTDICMSAKEKGLANYVIPSFCVHNTHQLLRLPTEFYKCYYYIRKKWTKYLPIYASCIRISSFNEEVILRKLHDFAEDVLGIKRLPKARFEDAGMIMDAINCAVGGGITE